MGHYVGCSEAAGQKYPDGHSTGF